MKFYVIYFNFINIFEESVLRDLEKNCKNFHNFLEKFWKNFGGTFKKYLREKKNWVFNQ